MTVAKTSIASFVETHESGKADAQRIRILNYVRACRVGVSRSDISLASGIPLQSVCGRVAELLSVGLVLEDAPRKCPRSQRWVKPVRAVRDLVSGVA